MNGGEAVAEMLPFVKTKEPHLDVLPANTPIDPRIDSRGT
jgi:hypothetical protein